ncbi:MAG: ATP-dependent Clp protease adaptor ClpS [Bacteroidetes bacterium]|nr:MAG: ATP-dependent Clp protease adaptor ClpS [Bacteroidota bacterium]MBL1144762.1 ATP-dependent Clp protease adaptor ClpS [Bacteroidota bacterium]NOG57556.1 ATP-dependent Clp protease adaptor ClpS [Bacteroidota bacterium]
MIIKEETILETAKELVEERQLILFNDDVNTFDHVIDCLIAICGHELTQAEQCAYIVHYNGKCVVKSGSFDKLKPLLTALQIQKLSVEIK